MSPRELNAWIRLGAILVVYVPYFGVVLKLFGGDGPIGRALCIAFIGATIAHALVAGLGEAVVQMIVGTERGDERDRAIEALSLRIAYFALLSLVMTALAIIALLGAISEPSDTGTILLPRFSVASQFVLFGFVCAEALRHAVQVFCYRHGGLVRA